MSDDKPAHGCIAMVREWKTDAERRAPLTPSAVGELVASGVPEGVIDDFELVEIEIQQRVGVLGVVMGDVQRRHKAVFEFASVDQPGQRIVRSLV